MWSWQLSGIRPVFSDYANSACDHRKFSDQRGRRITPHFGVSVQAQMAPAEGSWEYPVEEGIVSEKPSNCKADPGESSVRGSGRNAGSRVIQWAQNRHIPDACQKCQPVYFFLSWFMPAEKSTDWALGLCITGTMIPVTGRLLRRNHCGTEFGCVTLTAPRQAKSPWCDFLKSLFKHVLSEKATFGDGLINKQCGKSYLINRKAIKML